MYKSMEGKLKFISVEIEWDLYDWEIKTISYLNFHNHQYALSD